jgi:hypothetical protein
LSNLLRLGAQHMFDGVDHASTCRLVLTEGVDRLLAAAAALLQSVAWSLLSLHVYAFSFFKSCIRAVELLLLEF